jgi:hypothetical protein
MTNYYVDTALGDDGNAGTSEGAGNAWATIQKGHDSSGTGNLVYVKASGTYSEDISISINGTGAAWRRFEGYTTTPGDGGKVTVDGGSVRANCIDAATAAGDYYRMENFIFQNATGDGVVCDSSSTRWHFVNCQFDSNGGDGADVNSHVMFLDCTADGNSAVGFHANGTGVMFFNCTSSNNSTNQFDLGSIAGVAVQCTAYGAGASDTSVQLNQSPNVMYGLTVDNEGAAASTCIGLSSMFGHLVDTVLYDGATGVSASSAGRAAGWVTRNNAYFDCTTDTTNITEDDSALLAQTGDPFIDSGSRDYTPHPTDGLVNAGFQGFEDIGASESKYGLIINRVQ